MKTVYSIFVFISIFAMVSCDKESDLNQELSAADKVAAEGMEEAYESTRVYNDSLVWCDNSGSTCSLEFVNYCDSLYHNFDEEYNYHHNNYSHNNVGDDHHHSAMSMHNHGSNNQHGEGGEEGGHGHSIHGHNEMTELHALHQGYHPH
jgi:hypothetical protein